MLSGAEKEDLIKAGSEACVYVRRVQSVHTERGRKWSLGRINWSSGERICKRFSVFRFIFGKRSCHVYLCMRKCDWGIALSGDGSSLHEERREDEPTHREMPG